MRPKNSRQFKKYRDNLVYVLNPNGTICLKFTIDKVGGKAVIYRRRVKGKPRIVCVTVEKGNEMLTAKLSVQCGSLTEMINRAIFRLVALNLSFIHYVN